MHRPIHALLLAAGIGTGLTLAAAPAPAAPAPTRALDNAALGYWRAWSVLDLDETKRNLLRDAGSAADPDFVPSEELRALLADEDIEVILRATRRPHCDFGVDVDRGIDALLPHLAPMRDSARLLALDARVHLDDGDVDGAVERVAAGYRIAAHCASEPFLISSLVSLAVFATIDEVAAHVMTAQHLSEAQRAVLQDALGRFSADDPAGIKRGITSERDVFVSWVRDELTGPAAIERLDALTGDLPESEACGAELRAMIERGEGIEVQIELLERYYDLVLEAWDRDDAQAAVRRLGELVEVGEMGHLAQLLAPALTRVRANDDRADALYRAAQERLRTE